MRKNILQKITLSLGTLVALAANGEIEAAPRNFNWLANPGSSDLNTAANWSPAGPPGGISSDIAHFSTSSISSPTLSADMSLGAYNFEVSGYAITVGSTGTAATLTFNDAGITGSNAPQFETSATGSAIIFTAGSTSETANFALSNAGNITFNSATAGSSSFSADDATANTIDFLGTSSAQTTNFVLGTGSSVTFNGTSSAGSAALNMFGGAANFLGSSSASSAVVTLAVGASLDVQVPAITFGSITSDNASTITLGQTTPAPVHVQIGNLNTSTTIAGVISEVTGSASILEKIGTGTLTLSNDNEYTGGTIVTSGILSVPSGSLVSPVTVSSGGTLKGTGTMAGGLSNSGTVSPGNSIGTMPVHSYVANPGSTTLIEVSPTAVSSIAAFGTPGTISINDTGTTLALTFDPGTYVSPSSFPILTADGGVTGKFAAVTGSLPGFTIELQYPGTEVLLLLQKMENFFSQIVHGGNPGTVATVLDALSPTATGDLADVIAALHRLDPSALKSALNQLQPSLFKGLALAQEDSSIRVRQAISRRLDQLYIAECVRVCPEAGKHLTLWADGLGDYSLQRGIQQQRGFHTKMGGAILGLDYRCLQYFDAGAALSYTHTAVDWSASQGNGHIDSYYGAVYGNFTSDYVYVNAVALGSHNQYEAERKIVFPGLSRKAKNHHNGNEAEGNLEVGAYYSWGGYEIRPFDSFDYIWLHEAGFTERGADSLNTIVKSKNSRMLRNELGIGFSRCFTIHKSKLIPDIKLSWVREVRFQGKHYTVRYEDTDVPFTVYGMKPNRSLFSPAAGITWYDANERLSVAVLYDGEFGKNYTDHNGNLRLGYAF